MKEWGEWEWSGTLEVHLSLGFSLKPKQRPIALSSEAKRKRVHERGSSKFGEKWGKELEWHKTDMDMALLSLPPPVLHLPRYGWNIFRFHSFFSFFFLIKEKEKKRKVSWARIIAEQLLRPNSWAFTFMAFLSCLHLFIGLCDIF